MSTYGPWIADMMSDYFTGLTLKAMLVDATFVEDPNHDFRNDLTGEIVTAGYTAGGVTLTGVAITYETTEHEIRMACDDVPFGSIDITDVEGIVFYISTGSSATDRVLAADVFGPPAVPGTDTFTYQPDADGVIIGTIGG